MTRRLPESSSSLDLVARERLLAEAERIAHVGSFAWELATGEIHWSDELFRILGFAPGAIEPTADRFFAAIHPEDVARFREVAERVVATGVVEPVEFRLVRGDGTERHALSNGAAILDDEGRPIRFVGTVLDVTARVHADAELRRSEAVLREAQSIAQLGSFEWSPASNTTRWSDEIRRILGVPDDVPASPERFFAAIHPDDSDGVAREMQRFLRDAEPQPFECRVKRPDGTVRLVRLQARIAFDEAGAIDVVVGSMHDVTERRRLEAQLLQAQKMEALGRLAGGVAHDFNNLLTVVGLHTARLRKKGAGVDAEVIAQAVEHGAALTRQLLAFSRQSALTTCVVDLKGLVLEAERMVERIIGEDVRLEVDVLDGPRHVSGDSAQLTQVVMNLLVNARDALPSGGTIRMTLTDARLLERDDDFAPSLEPGDYVALTVADDGIGMDDHVRNHVFEPFFTTKEVGRGTGLGLAMVFGVASQSRGGVRVRSARGQGTTIDVYLPLATAREAEDGHTKSAVVVGRGERILLVEDDDVLRDATAAVLSEAGYAVRDEPDAATALAYLETSGERIDLLITDVVLPGLTGPSLARVAQTMRSDLPILYLSGYAPDGFRDEAPPAGGFLAKPFTPEALTAQVRLSLAR